MELILIWHHQTKTGILMSSRPLQDITCSIWDLETLGIELLS